VLENVLYSYRSVLFAVSDLDNISPVKTVIRTATIGQSLNFACYAGGRGGLVDFRCGKEKKTLLIFRAGLLCQACDSEVYKGLFMEIGDNWYNLTVSLSTIASSEEFVHCFCFQADGGPLVEYVTTFVAGIFFIFCVTVYVCMY